MGGERVDRPAPVPQPSGPSLASHQFLPSYETGERDLIREFYRPSFESATQYCRAVGFFSSSLIGLLSPVLPRFVAAGGKICLIVSPRLSPEDVAAIDEGYRGREKLQDLVGKRILEEMERIAAEGRLGKAIGNLAWLVAHGVVDIKLAVPVHHGRVSAGIYHEKLGYFRDASGNVVAFVGSNNESEMAVWHNFESLWVFTTWEGEEHRRDALEIVDKFEARWANDKKGLLVLDFPKAPREWLKARAPEKLASREMDPPPAGELPSPYDYQEQAVAAWVHAGRKGILEMATGTGKTITALHAVKDAVQASRPVVLAVPTVALQTQWREKVRAYFPQARVLMMPGDRRWRSPGALETWLDGSRPTFVIGVSATLSKAGVVERIARCCEKRQTTLIVDEVHHVGSEQRSLLLNAPFADRLGLSATPEREFDEEGSAKISDFFGDVVFRFGIGDAIRKGVLTPYDYRLEELELAGSEVDAFLDLSRRIVRARHALKNDLGVTADASWGRLRRLARQMGRTRRLAQIEGLLIQRADIAKNARGKPAFARRFLERYAEMRKVLVYCDDLAQMQLVEAELRSAGIGFVRYEGSMEREARRQALTAIEFGPARAIVSIRCLDEGVDLPRCDGAIILASSKSRREFVQRRGRVLRRDPGKIYSTIVDPIVVPPLAQAREPGVGTLVESELRRAVVFIRDATNRAIAQNRAEEIATRFRVGLDLEDDEHG